MASSTVRTFTDSDDYAAAIRGGTVELTVVGRGDFNAKLTRVELHRLWMQRFSENLPRVCDVTNLITGRTYITFRTKPGPSLLWGGAQMLPTNIVRHRDGASTFQRSSGSASFGAMSLPVDDMAAVGGAMAGFDLTPPRDTVLVTPTPPR